MTELDTLTLEFARKYPAQFAQASADGEIADIGALLNTMPDDLAASVAACLPLNRVGALLSLDSCKPEAWLEAASFDHATALLSRLPSERRLALVNNVGDRSRRRRLHQFLNYPSHSVGALVSDSLVRYPHNLSLAALQAQLLALGTPDRPPQVVIEEDGKYLGVLNLWKMMMSTSGQGKARDFTESVPHLRPETALRDAAHADQWRNRGWLPVVDHDQRVLGIISRSRVLEIIKRDQPAQSGVTDSLTVLAGQFLFVMGALLERLLAPGKPA